MKRVFIYSVVIGLILVLHSCDPKHGREQCEYKYPLNITNLKDTIKTTDTLWVENDFNPRFCLSEGIYKNGIVKESPFGMKLINDTLVHSYIKVINYSEKIAGLYGIECYTIQTKEQDGKYQSKYGIVFPEQGTYLLSGFGGLLENAKDGNISLTNYFNTSSNNNYLLPPKIQEQYPNMPYNNYVHFFVVVE